MDRKNIRDDELSKDFFRVERRAYDTAVLVRTIHWDGPAHPFSIWVVGATVAAGAGPQQIQSAVRKLLGSKRFFRVCEECGERTPLGHMDDRKICQGCAELNHGVVH